MQLNPARGRKLHVKGHSGDTMNGFMQLNPARGRKHPHTIKTYMRNILFRFMQLNPARGRKPTANYA